jgi:hypothetical protein
LVLIIPSTSAIEVSAAFLKTVIPAEFTRASGPSDEKVFL